MHAQIVLFDGFDPLDVIAPFEVLHAGGVTVELVSAEGARDVVSGSGGLTLRANAMLDPARVGVVLVPGAAGLTEDPGDRQDEYIPVLLGRTLTTALPALLKDAMDNPSVTVATVCGGSLVLAMAGLLEGRYATTHHLGLDMLDATGTHAVRARVVDDGDLVSGAGVTSGLDLALHLLEREIGPQVAHAVEELFAHERRGIVWRNQGPVLTSL
ncbi:putative intracellular protease/amidase [Kibdelosporangium banguiense]|uniref:Intracellular protease/amidase n=1 Tax=Kibdelosporangium banguiense TaxID=1365924 RepID=A0ABS4U1A2_9PSEU|nr:DJ-1/PfpI family protein [Kibdelosporangium banguiense]MBP2330415.1 putative intracellular protease/amidase [Kibdelosporangium banguiense]